MDMVNMDIGNQHDRKGAVWAGHEGVATSSGVTTRLSGSNQKACAARAMIASAAIPHIHFRLFPMAIHCMGFGNKKAAPCEAAFYFIRVRII
jgi:hypothetical protein